MDSVLGVMYSLFECKRWGSVGHEHPCGHDFFMLTIAGIFISTTKQTLSDISN